MALLNVGKRTLLRISGADAARYLNGQITQDVHLAMRNRDRAFATCVTDAKGRMQAYGSIFSLDGQSIFVEAPLELREILLARLERYLIADDAEITDVSDDFFLIHQLAESDGSESLSEMAFAFERLGMPGVDHWLSANTATEKAEMTWDAAEGIRIAQGTPRWGAELMEGILPPEAGLEARAISYTKGCYIGQEVISRMKTAGKVNRCVARFSVENDGATLPDLDAADILRGDLVVGKITSFSGGHAMGWIKKNAFEGTSFVTSNGIRLTRVF